jgi:hypothetical protein
METAFGTLELYPDDDGKTITVEPPAAMMIRLPDPAILPKKFRCHIHNKGTAPVILQLPSESEITITARPTPKPKEKIDAPIRQKSTD